MHPIAVAAADDVADAVLVAVDGELVVDGQGAALRRGSRPSCCSLKKATPACRTARGSPPKRAPARAVDVVQSLVRIDEVVPQFIEGFGQLSAQPGCRRRQRGCGETFGQFHVASRFP